jgi:hypothetical protein
VVVVVRLVVGVVGGGEQAYATTATAAHVVRGLGDFGVSARVNALLAKLGRHEFLEGRVVRRCFDEICCVVATLVRLNIKNKYSFCLFYFVLFGFLLNYRSEKRAINPNKNPLKNKK